jgi:hypothetical protein
LNLVEVAAHLLDLVVERSALRGLAAEQHEEAVAFAAGAPRRRFLAVEFGLLARRGLFESAELVGAGFAPAAAVESLKLGLEPRAVGIALRRQLLLRSRGQRGREEDDGGQERAAPRRIHRMSRPLVKRLKAVRAPGTSGIT